MKSKVNEWLNDVYSDCSKLSTRDDNSKVASFFLFVFVRRYCLEIFGRNFRTIHHPGTRIQIVTWVPGSRSLPWYLQGGAIKTGPPYLIANILKFHDRIAWKLVNFWNIICWTQSLTFCLKISSRCGAPSENTATVIYSHCTNRFEHHTVPVFSLGGATARWNF